jgi:hypothetical protein
LLKLTLLQNILPVSDRSDMFCLFQQVSDWQQVSSGTPVCHFMVSDVLHIFFLETVFKY